MFETPKPFWLALPKRIYEEFRGKGDTKAMRDLFYPIQGEKRRDFREEINVQLELDE